MKVFMSHVLNNPLDPVYGYSYLCSIKTNAQPEHILSVIREFVADNDHIHLLYTQSGNILISQNISVARHISIADKLKAYLENEPLNVVMYCRSGDYTKEMKTLAELYGSIRIINEFPTDDTAEQAAAAINEHQEADVAAICINLGSGTLKKIEEKTWIPVIYANYETGSFTRFEEVK